MVMFCDFAFPCSFVLFVFSVLCFYLDVYVYLIFSRWLINYTMI